MLELPPITWQAVLLGLTVALCGYVLSRALNWATSRFLHWRGRSDSSRRVFAGLVQAAVIVISLGAALTIVFPSVKPVDILGGIGLFSLAIGIAFQTVLGNMFAGMVILARDRFRVGDQISLKDHAGTVVEMQLSHTAIRTFDGRLVLIPNSALHSEIVTVQTGFEYVRTTVTFDLTSGTDLPAARTVALNAIRELPSVLSDPPAQALFSRIDGTGTIQLDLRFWTSARQLDTKEAQDAVIEHVLGSFAENGITIGTPPLAVRLVERPGTDK
ncbi:mechanosensitive ion channel family protein [Corynebacterium pygosceleis]|uniref:Mechanosensitive ion channel n=1 Tax=Corynebacterium pygosceleis TaxID=2800406 RepID=A0A9Q4GL41_9CORY|nr:mechanosensitive ion channel domain-containing protein [Corynebacterium pygosceleis]MCK7638116.1 mechanosensitive ion channel family protein [Corynebacterium pygosceleis]MCK7675830.1 mechanosensitive ion channel family protein [Corynebacterium pygosceleis]MCL0120788.1 mechanosensitive ion channel family protein [Corynebacterium pygosceleis]MCX7444329.1 mechanosensitive ion channel [Corynebacterium pygosceleis]MCX7468832.1 mechanosensitive ion channel [Corynebacterium pygosceleis]